MDVVAIIRYKGCIIKVTNESNIDKAIQDAREEYCKNDEPLAKVSYLCNDYGYAHGFVKPEHSKERVKEENLILDFEWHYIRIE